VTDHAVVVDAHHHFWDPAGADYPWLTDELASIRRRFGPEDLEPLLAPAGVDLTVLVQTRSSLDETREFLRVADATTFIAGVVGWVDLTEPDVDGVLARLRSGAGGGGLVAIRHQVHDEPDADWLRRADVRRGIAAAGAAGLAYDLLVRPRELPAALDTVRSLPDVRFVIDHLAKPPIRDGALEPWASLIRPLGREPNVWAKVSGLVTEADWQTWTAADLAPFVDVAIETFGPDRLLVGSDWPVCLLAATYGEVLDAARTLVASLSADERASFLGRNAIEVYRLETGARRSSAGGCRSSIEGSERV
jgi:L-fuconolactonase